MAVAIAVGIVVVGAGWFGTGSRAPVALGAGPPQSAAASAVSLVVHVSGAVAHPGLVSVPAGSRVADALVAAGGASRRADLGKLNLATPLRDGEHVDVPSMASDSPSVAGGSATDGAVDRDGRVAINRASPTELQMLPGVGPVLAARIVAHRDASGPFTTVEDLLDVPGIGEGKLAQMRDAVVVP